MKTATILAFLLLGLACTYALPAAEEEIAEDGPAVEDELIENDEEEPETDEEEDEEKRTIHYPRRCRFCRRKIVYKKLYGKRVKYYCTQHCRCKGLCRYNRCYHGYWCSKYVCSRYSYPKCRYY